jgi:integration host factor subunit beta
MIRSDLVWRIWRQNRHLQRREVETFIHAIFDEITATLVRGDRVELRGFGVFSIRIHEARTGRNPRTGALVAVPKRAIPNFRVGKELKQRYIRQTD